MTPHVKDQEKRIEDIIHQMKDDQSRCSRDFSCLESAFANICKAKDFGLHDFVKCLEEKPHECSFSLSFGYGHLCKCPLRIYIAKTLGK